MTSHLLITKTRDRHWPNACIKFETTFTSVHLPKVLGPLVIAVVELVVHVYSLYFWLQANYGRHDAECVKKVKDIYRSLQLPEVYSDYEQSSYESLLAVIDECNGTMPREMFRAYARKIYKRQK